MVKRKEPKELIEILLRQQRTSRRERQDPLEGIEWSGLPSELKDRVYRPPETHEPLVDLLTSVQSEKRNDRDPHDADLEHPVEVDAPEERGRSAPARPSWWHRTNAWLGDFFAFLNKAYEVRVATMVAFAGGAVVVACLCFLLGRAGVPRVSLDVYDHSGSPESLEIVRPLDQGRAEVKDVVGAGAQAPADKKAPSTANAPKPSFKAAPLAKQIFAIRVVTVQQEKDALERCQYLAHAGQESEDPRYYLTKGGYVVLLGKWASDAIARKRQEALAPIFEKMRSARLVSRLDQMVTQVSY